MGPEIPQQWNSPTVNRELPNSFCHSVYFNHWNWGIWKIFPRTERPRGLGGRGSFLFFESKALVMRYPVNNTNRTWLIDNEGSNSGRAWTRETKRSMIGMQWWPFVNTYWEKAKSEKSGKGGGVASKLCPRHRTLPKTRCPCILPLAVNPLIAIGEMLSNSYVCACPHYQPF